MTAIKEYPFDLSDLKNQPNPVDGDESRLAPTQLTHTITPTSQSPSSASATEGKRKVSIMADESSKDRENLPSDRYVRNLKTYKLSPRNKIIRTSTG